MRDPYARALREHAARIEAAERRLATTVLTGKVVAVDPDKRQLRLKLTTSADGREVLSPWIRWQEAGVGALSVHSQPAINEQMMVVSMSGTLGTGSIAVPATFDKDHASPSKATDTTVIARGDTRISLKADKLVLEAGGASIELSAGEIKTLSEKLLHNGHSVGDDHKHTDVIPGGGLSGPPA